MKTLIEAIILVILVVYVFCKTSLYHDSAGRYRCFTDWYVCFHVRCRIQYQPDYAFALVLVIGTVVDDAIVVVEAVQARFDVGYKSSLWQVSMR